MFKQKLTEWALRDDDFLSLVRADLLDDKASQLEKEFEDAKRLAEKWADKNPPLWVDGFCEAMEKSIAFLRHEADLLREGVNKGV